MITIEYSTLRSSIAAILAVYHKSGAYGVMFMQIRSKDSHINKRAPYSNKICVELAGLSQEEVQDRADEVTQQVSGVAYSGRREYQFDTARQANWYFVEYTPSTKNITNKFKYVVESDFKGHSKSIVYFDMDMKENIPSNYYSLMTQSEKYEWVVNAHKDVINKIIESTDPIYITFTGNGIHVAYRVDGMEFGDKQWSTSVEAYASAYALYAKKLSVITRWKFDLKCSNINRIDRLPGTINLKFEDHAKDAEAKLLHINADASGSFLAEYGGAVMYPVVHSDYTKASAQAPSLYAVLPYLKDSKIYVYNRLMQSLSFRMVFEKLNIINELQFPEETEFSSQIKGFRSCLSPFRTPILGHTPSNVESSPSFRFDEKTLRFWDFGAVPNVDKGYGDIIGLAYALIKFRDSGEWPDKLDEETATDIVGKEFLGKSLTELDAEVVGFTKDLDTGTIIADFSVIAKVLLRKLLNKYHIVYNSDQQQLCFRGVVEDADAHFKVFPGDCPEFGQKDKSTSARLLLSLGGLGTPSIAVQSTAKHFVDALCDPCSVKCNPDKISAFFDIEGIRDITIPVVSLSNAVLKFTDSVYYHIKNGEVSDYYEGFAYDIPVSYASVMESSGTVYFEKLLNNIVGEVDSPGRMAFNYMLAQMWIPAHGDSRALVIKGNGRNGKSTFVKVMTAILPKGVSLVCNMDTITGVTSAGVANRLKMLGKHLVIVSDVTEHKLPQELKPIITGDGGITAKLLFKNPISFKNTATLFFMTNSFPRVSEDVAAFLRRFVLIESKVRITTVIPNMEELIIKEELPGVWKYIITAIEFFRSNYEFVFPEHEEWAKNIITPMKRSLLNQYIAGELALCLTPTEGKVVSVRDLYEYLLEYADTSGSKKPSLKAFSAIMASTVESDYDIYDRADFKSLEAAGMDEKFVTVYKNGQMEYIVNAEFHPPISGIPIKGAINRSMDAVLTLRANTRDVVFQSIKYPSSPSSEVLARLVEWINTAHDVNDIHSKKFRNESISFAPTRTYSHTANVPPSSRPVEDIIKPSESLPID